MAHLRIYDKDFIRQFSSLYDGLPVDEVLNKLQEMGLLNPVAVSATIIREHVATLLSSGEKKTDAMWMATEHFGCSYEYVRKCVYFYPDANLRPETSVRLKPRPRCVK